MLFGGVEFYARHRFFAFPAGTRGQSVGSMRPVFLLLCMETHGMMGLIAVKETGKLEVVEVTKMMPTNWDNDDCACSTYNLFVPR